MIYSIYPNALDCGIDHEKFWDYSIAEIRELLLSYKRKRTIDEKIKIEQLFVLAEAISARVAFCFADKDERDVSMILQPWDFYPELFAEDEAISTKRQEEIEFEKYKEARKRHAVEFNRRRAE